MTSMIPTPGDAMDFLKDEYQVETPPGANSSGPDINSDLPMVKANARQLNSLTDEVMEILTDANDPPVVFVRSGALVRIKMDENGRPIIDSVNDNVLTNRVARVANFMAYTSKGEHSTTPPPVMIRDIIAIGTWPFPALEGVVEVPMLRPDGTILEQPGYDPGTHLTYIPNANLSVPPIPESPTSDDVAAAVALVADVLADFPFVDDASRANCWAALLTAIIRQAIEGHVPIGLFDAPRSGTGKGLLTEVISIISTGRSAAMFSAPKDDEEWRKQITSALLVGSTIVVIDNVENRLAAPSLAKAVTAHTWVDRILKTNEAVHLPQNATWFITGNNITLGGDLPRRCYPCRIDSRVQHPWERMDFKHVDLEKYVTENRGALIAALLTMARGWYAGGQPDGGATKLGSFLSWCRIIGGILAFAKIDGFLTNLPSMYSLMDMDTPVWSAFFDAWYAAIGPQPLQVNEVTKLLQASADSSDPDESTFRQCIPDGLEGEFGRLIAGHRNNFNRRLGKALSRRVDTTFDNDLQLCRAKDESHTKVARWCVTKPEDRTFNPEICGVSNPYPANSGTKRGMAVIEKGYLRRVGNPSQLPLSGPEGVDIPPKPASRLDNGDTQNDTPQNNEDVGDAMPWEENEE